MRALNARAVVSSHENTGRKIAIFLANDSIPRYGNQMNCPLLGSIFNFFSLYMTYLDEPKEKPLLGSGQLI